MPHVLFICTGNYYRSRFAEALFNAQATERGLSWRAFSRGTDVYGAGRWNVGPLSQWAREALDARGIPLDGHLGLPVQLIAADLAQADLLIALSEAEHRPHLERDFPDAVQRTTFWGVEDLHLSTAAEALAQIERNVLALLDRLADAWQPSPSRPPLPHAGEGETRSGGAA